MEKGVRKNIAGYEGGSPWIEMGFTREMLRDLGWVGMVWGWMGSDGAGWGWKELDGVWMGLDGVGIGIGMELG